MLEFNEIENLEELAALLEVPSGQLKYILYTKDNLYKQFKILKSSGGFRTIHAPVNSLKRTQRNLSNKILDYINTTVKNDLLDEKIAHGFTKEKSIITNAEAHRNKRIVLNLDLENFFPSIHFGRVKGYFNKNRHFKLNHDVSIMIAQITCHKGELPQGAPTSPIISNLIANILDMNILRIVKKYKLDYTRYVDDLTFSTNEIKFIKQKKEFLDELEKVIKASGFSINKNKSHIQYDNSRQVVTGLTVNQKLNTKKEFRKDTRAMAHSLYSQGFFYIDENLGNLNKLEGRFSFINQLDKYNNKNGRNKKKNLRVESLNGREKEYQKFLYYKHFIVNSKPLIITEGKTDLKHLKNVLNELIQRRDKKYGNEFRIQELDFLNRFRSRENKYKMNKLDYFLGSEEGASGLQALLEFYSDEGNPRFSNYWKEFTEKYELQPNYPVILLFDNEEFNKSPLVKFVNRVNSLKINNAKKIKDDIEKNNYAHLLGNLYLLPLPRQNDKDTEIENLYKESTFVAYQEFYTLPKKVIDDKNKNRFANWISKNISNQDLSRFEDLFRLIIEISDHYQSQLEI